MSLRVSILIPCYNDGVSLPRAVASALGQTAGEVEAVIVNDGSSDDSGEIADRLAREAGGRVTVLHQANAGLAAARNVGLRASAGEYVVALDADDALDPNMVQACLRGFEAGAELAGVAGVAVLEDEAGEEVGELPPRANTSWPEILEYNPMGAGNAVLLRRVAVEAVGGWDEDLRAAEDWDLYVRLARRGLRFGAVAERVACYTQRAGGLGRDAMGMLEAKARVIEKACQAGSKADVAGLNSEMRIRLLHGAVCHSLGIAAAHGGDAGQVELIAAHAPGPGVDTSYSAEQFVWGYRHGGLPEKRDPQLPRRAIQRGLGPLLKRMATADPGEAERLKREVFDRGGRPTLMTRVRSKLSREHPA